MLLGWSLACADVGPARSGGTCDGDGMFFSTTFTILDEAGNLRLDPTVSYRVDGGPCTEAGCLHLTSDYLCTTWYAGFEEAEIGRAHV